MAVSLNYNPSLEVTYASLKSPDVWDAIIAIGHFSSFVKPDNIGPFFAKVGLDSESGIYHRTAVTLNPQKNR
ncbi:uncharacterized protein LY79DRAFT_670267 [Colletotrichum navitas]|uniref:Uncharacterized protein n=1 Tax=Colletotrichum navitas TaxID=681940 RepID=A0AAD8V4Z8_9PEZI|nr:uncharacterized protein LY79DRAFT_670267 [Colletotrichum navitas]KAK1589864.1 hypothetical protein LY79DRAFT_670267 [Colletotrichum navitas]